MGTTGLITHNGQLIDFNSFFLFVEKMTSKKDDSFDFNSTLSHLKSETDKVQRTILENHPESAENLKESMCFFMYFSDFLKGIEVYSKKEGGTDA